MSKLVQWMPMLVAGAVAALVTVGATALYPQISQAVDNVPLLARATSITAATPVTPTIPTAPGKSTMPGVPNQNDKASGRWVDAKSNREAQLAEALGITTDELTAAYKKAFVAAIDKAVADDLITQTQADTLKQRLESADGNGFHGFGFEGPGRFGGSIEMRALLADALGITTDELTAAEQKAHDAAIDQAVADGTITQEQADTAKAMEAYRNYWRAQQGTYSESVDKALKAGAITQAQADLLKKNAESFPGMGGRSMIGPGMRGRGMGDDMQNGQGQEFGPGRGGQRGHGRGFPAMPNGNNGPQNQQGGSGDSQGDTGFFAPDASF